MWKPAGLSNFFSFAVSSHLFSLPFTTAHLCSSWPLFFNILLSLWSSFSRELKFLPFLQSCCHVSSYYIINQEATINISSHHTASHRQSDSLLCLLCYCSTLSASTFLVIRTCGPNWLLRAWSVVSPLNVKERLTLGSAVCLSPETPSEWWKLEKSVKESKINTSCRN